MASTLLFACFAIIAMTAMSVTTAYAKPAPPTIVPLYFGENKGSRGENLPMQENYKKILTFVEQDLNIQFQYRFFPWNRAVKMASNEGGLIFGLSSTPEREKIFSFSTPATYNYIWLVTRTDKTFTYRTLNDLKGKTIGIVRGSKYGGEFDAKRGVLFKTDDDLDSYDIRLRKLLEKRTDVMLFASSTDNSVEAAKAVNKIALSGMKPAVGAPRFSVLSTPILKNDIRFAILKGTDDKLIDRLSKSLNKLNAVSNSSSNSASNKSKKHE